MSRFLNGSLSLALAALLVVAGFVGPVEAAAPTGTVHGVIHKEGGGLLVRSDNDVTVELYRDTDLAAPVMSTDLTSTSYGEFQIAAVPAGRYAVKFVSRNRLLVGEWWGDTRRAAQRAFIEVTEGGTVELPVELSITAHLTGSLTGRNVILPETGLPIQVTATSGDSEQDSWLPFRVSGGSLNGVGGSSGAYDLYVLPGAYTVSFTDTTGAHVPLTLSHVAVAAPETRRDVVLSAAWASISGTWALKTSEGLVPFDATHGYPSPVVYKWSAVDAAWIGVNPAGGANESVHFADRLSAGRYKFAVSYKGGLTFWGGGDLQSAPEIVLGSAQSLNGIDVTVDDPATVSATIAVRYSDGSVHPADSGLATVWRKTASGGYEPVPGALSGSTTQGYTSGDGVLAGSLAPGTYRFRFWRHRDPDHGAIYIGGSRFLDGAQDVTIGLSENLDLGTIVVPSESLTVTRIAGPDRFATAVGISRQAFPNGALVPVVYLTNAFNYPDALAAGPAAAHTGGVILPVAQTGVPDVIAAELKRLRPRRVVIAGGPSVVSDAVQTAVRTLVPADTVIQRLGGADRYATGDLIVRDAFGTGSHYAIIATGRNYPDALAAGPAASHLRAPVILIDGAGRLASATKATIASLRITDVYLAGGTSVVGSPLETDLRGLLGADHVTRLAGVDRFETAQNINRAIFESSDDAFVASGGGYADALAGGPLAAKRGAPLFLSPQTCIGEMFAIRIGQPARLTLLGGESVLGPRVVSLAPCG